MKTTSSSLLDQARIRLKNKKILYWLAGGLFWSGVLFSTQYYIAQTGTLPSIFPGLLMISGIVIYLIGRMKR